MTLFRRRIMLNIAQVYPVGEGGWFEQYEIVIISCLEFRPRHTSNSRCLNFRNRAEQRKINNCKECYHPHKFPRNFGGCQNRWNYKWHINHLHFKIKFDFHSRISPKSLSWQKEDIQTSWVNRLGCLGKRILAKLTVISLDFLGFKSMLHWKQKDWISFRYSM